MIAQLTNELGDILVFDRILQLETIQSLWSGYGSLFRASLQGSEYDSIIVKHIAPPPQLAHPRGWNSDMGHQRKLHSYDVEATWYTEYNHRTNDHCRTPSLIGFKRLGDHTLLVLEDLNPAGYYIRKNTLDNHEVKRCLEWLAAFHARFMHQEPQGLWKVGTYWNLDTRPEEYEAMTSGPLKTHARAIDEALNNCHFQTLVHGDAKYANFCFSEIGDVAAVDFQYVGGGCGMKDVAYLLSCIENGLENDGFEEELLTHYFASLRSHLAKTDPSVDFRELETEWRHLYCFAWADFERFLLGWAPDHWKSSAYSKMQTEKALATLRN